MLIFEKPCMSVTARIKVASKSHFEKEGSDSSCNFYRVDSPFVDIVGGGISAFHIKRFVLMTNAQTISTVRTTVRDTLLISRLRINQSGSFIEIISVFICR